MPGSKSELVQLALKIESMVAYQIYSFWTNATQDHIIEIDNRDRKKGGKRAKSDIDSYGRGTLAFTTSWSCKNNPIIESQTQQDIPKMKYYNYGQLEYISLSSTK